MIKKPEEIKSKQNSINIIEIVDERKKIMNKIVNRTVKCSKSTQELTSKIINCLVLREKEKLISYCEKGLPDDLPELRSLIWKINLGYLSSNIEQWDKTIKSQRIAYKNYKNYVVSNLEKEIELYKDYKNMTRQQKEELDKKTSRSILEDICKDTNRTHTEMNFFIKPVDKNIKFTEEEILKLVKSKRDCTLKNINEIYKINIVLTHCDIISRILFIYCKFEPMISYVQGMNEILSAIYYCFSFDREDDDPIEDLEADAFWSFYFLMINLKDLFDQHEDNNDKGISGKLRRLKEMLKFIDHKLYNYLEEIKFNFSVVGFKWIALLFSQDFEMVDLLRIWDFLLCRENKFENCYYFCLSIILMKKEKILNSKLLEIYGMIQNIQDLNLEDIIINAIYISNKCGKKFKEIMENNYFNNEI